MKKKLLHVIESAGGGALQYVFDICTVLPKEEWDIEVVYSRRWVTPSDIAEHFGDLVKLTEVNMSREISPRNDFVVYRYLYKKFREQKWDLIHLHSSKAGALGRIAARGLKIPMVYTPHGYSFYQQDISRVKQRIYYRIEQLLDFIHPIKLLVSSTNEYNDAMKIAKNSERVYKISNSVPIPIVQRLQSPDNEFLIITVGRFTAAKNPQMMLDVIEAVHRHIPYLRFVWIGDGEQRDVVTKEAQRRGLPFETTGWLERSEIEDWYQRCHVYIQASLWEGLPLALLEAMSYSCAVVVSDIPAHRELIQDEGNGIIADNIEGYLKGILKLEGNSDFRKALGINSRMTIAENNNIDQFAMSLIDFYHHNLKEGIDFGSPTTTAGIHHHPML